MIVNYDVPVGTEIMFGPSSRLRSINMETRQFQQKEMMEGVVIGEGRKGKIVQRVENNKKVAYVVEVETGHFGWVYNFEFNLI